MSITLRTWLAGLALAFSALVLSSYADPVHLGMNALLAFVVVYTHGWVVAVAERIGPARGGLGCKRFPLGPRLLECRPLLFGQMLVPVGLFFAVTMDWRVAAVGVAVVSFLAIDMLRRWLPYLVPAALVIHAVSTMDEFHTLGDLVQTAHSWVTQGVWMVLWVTLLAGPLLRTDVGGRLTTGGKLLAFAAGLPSYAAGVWLFSRTGLTGLQPDLRAVALVLLAGGVVQSLVLSLFGRSAELADRPPEDLSPVSPNAVGMALMPMAVPVLACLVLEFAPLPAQFEVLAPGSAWVVVATLLVLVPAVAAAALAASGLDHADGRRGARAGALVSVSALGAWFVFGPAALARIWAADGVLVQLADVFPVDRIGVPVLAASGSMAQHTGSLPGGDFSLWGLPAADLSRAVTLMLFACAALSARWVRHARRGVIGVGAGSVALTYLLVLLGGWLLMAATGPWGAPLGAAAGCLVMLAVDAVRGTRVAPVEIPVDHFDDLSPESVDNLEIEAVSLDHEVSVGRDGSRSPVTLEDPSARDAMPVEIEETPSFLASEDEDPEGMPADFDIPAGGLSVDDADQETASR